MIEIWIHKNKGYIASELRDLIEDLEDEHYSTPKFFEILDSYIYKWKLLWEHNKKVLK